MKKILIFANIALTLIVILNILALLKVQKTIRVPAQSRPRTGSQPPTISSKKSRKTFEILSEKAGYQIIYKPKLNQYYIDIFYRNFRPVRLEAEQDLLQILQISQAEGCKLKVVTTAQPFTQSPKTFSKLSFCP